jgi:hypothetical protein
MYLGLITFEPEGAGAEQYAGAAAPYLICAHCTLHWDAAFVSFNMAPCLFFV